MFVMMWDTCCGWMKRKGFRERVGLGYQAAARGGLFPGLSCRLISREELVPGSAGQIRRFFLYFFLGRL